MRMMATVLIVGLIVGGATLPYAEAADSGEASIDTPIASIELDAQGAVTRVTFTNNAYLANPQLDPKDLVGHEIRGIRPLPFQLLTVGDPANPQLVVVAKLVGTTPVTIPPGSSATLNVQSDGQVELLIPPTASCPAGWCPAYGKCKPCSKATNFIDARSPYLIESDTQMGVITTP
jgi:hypothetical protein